MSRKVVRACMDGMLATCNYDYNMLSGLAGRNGLDDLYCKFISGQCDSLEDVCASIREIVQRLIDQPGVVSFEMIVGINHGVCRGECVETQKGATKPAPRQFIRACLLATCRVFSNVSPACFIHHCY